MQFTTPQAAKRVAALIGSKVTAKQLWSLIERGEIPAPPRLNATTFGWTEDDIERARKAMAIRAARRGKAPAQAVEATAT